VITMMLVFTGTMNTLTSKFQNVNGFRHGTFQSWIVVLGQVLNMPVFLASISKQGGVKSHFSKLKKRAQKKDLKIQFPTLILCFTSLVDSTIVFLETLALLLIPPSV